MRGLTHLLLFTCALGVSCGPSPGIERHPQQLRCKTSELRDSLRQHRRPRHTARLHDLAAAPLQLRDPFGKFTDVLTSEHFALKSGPDRSIDPELAQVMLSMLETAWQKEVGEEAMPPPAGTDEFLMNVYIGNTGGAAPETDVVGGWVVVDDEGYPLIVMHPDFLEQSTTEYIGATLAHEFFHTIQFSSGLFTIDDTQSDEYLQRYYWFWEASADWVAEEQYPSIGATFVGAYEMLPEVGLEYVDYPDTGSLVEAHHYGAAIFLRYLTEFGGDPTIVNRVWREAQPGVTPVKAMATLVEARGLTLSETLLRSAAHIAVWDFKNNDAYRASRDSMLESYPHGDHSISLELAGTGDAWVQAPAATLPMRLGYNVTRLKLPQKGHLEIDFQGAAVGSDGSPAVFGALAIKQTANGPVYLELPMNGLQATAQLDLDGTETSVLLVVAALPAASVTAETFSYSVRMRPAPAVMSMTVSEMAKPEVVDLTQAPSTGCSVGGQSASVSGNVMTLALLMALWSWRRRAVLKPHFLSSRSNVNPRVH